MTSQKKDKDAAKKTDAEDFAFGEKELSEEDIELKKKLELYVERLSDPEVGLVNAAIEGLKNEVRSSTSSMTSIPKPFKFLKPCYEKIKEGYSRYPAETAKRGFADLVSVLAITMAAPESNEALTFALEGTKAGITSWGHEYLRTLTGDIAREYSKRLEKGGDTELKDLQFLIDDIVTYYMTHNVEPEAVDFLLEINRLPMLIDLCTEYNYERVCLYLLSCNAYSADMEEYEAGLTVCYKICRLRKDYTAALRAALKLNNTELIANVMKECKDPGSLKQMAFMLARQSFMYQTRNEELNSIINNQKLSDLYRGVAKELQVWEPRSIEKILKRNLEETKKTAINAILDSAKKNLSETYVSAFVNIGFGTDDLLTARAAEWLPKNKDSGKFAAAAGLGLIHMWDPDVGMNMIDKYLYIPDDYIVAGAYFAHGLSSCRVRNEFDPALQILFEAIAKPKNICKIGGILGLSFAYAGTSRPEILEMLTPLVIDTSYPIEMSSMAALCLSIVFVGTCNPDVLNAIMQGITEREPSSLESHPLSRYFALALGLVFLGQQEKIETTVEAVQLIPPTLAKFAKSTLTFCAYAGTGNVAKVQELLQSCVDHLQDKEALYQIASVIGIAVIANGEEIGNEMAFRSMKHLLQYGEPAIRRAVPLALSLLSLSHPSITTMDTLVKLAYDTDKEVAQSAIFALGLIGAGTNNSRLAEALRQLASFSSDDNDTLFIVRIAQGLLQMGKGLITLDPMHSDKFLLSQVGLAGILASVFACTNLKGIVFADYHYLLYYVALAASPRICMTVNEQLEPLLVNVRVGLAVDVAGQAGKPKTITGFQTHTAPVLLGYGERAELATEEYVPLTNVLEDFVILKTNPEYIEMKK